METPLPSHRGSNQRLEMKIQGDWAQSGVTAHLSESLVSQLFWYLHPRDIYTELK